MSILSATAIASLQRATAKLLPDTVVIKREEESATESDGAGGRKPVAGGNGWNTVATVAGLLVATKLTPRERVVADQIQTPISHHVFVIHPVDAQAKDRLFISERIFEVQAVAAGDSWGIRDRIYCVELQK